MNFDVTRDFEYRGHRVVVRMETNTHDMEIRGGQDPRTTTVPKIYIDGKQMRQSAGLFASEETYDAELRKYLDILITQGAI